MHAEPAEWHSFGDAPPVAAPVASAQIVRVQPQLTGWRGRVGQNAWFAVGATILSVVVGVAVFVSTLVFAGGDRDQVVIAAGSTPGVSPRVTVGVGEKQQVAATAGLTAGTVLVDVEGAVRVPGLHRVPAGSRVGDAIATAGGYAESADLEAAASTLNLAELLIDGAKIRVPQIGDRPIGMDPQVDLHPGTSAPLAGGLIDLNHAGEAALDSLPGIGPVTVAKIIEAREAAPFASLDDLVSRSVVSASVLEKIRGLATVTP
jgi:competence protein ComEA